MKRHALALALTIIAMSGCQSLLTPFTDGIGFRDMVLFQDQAIATRNTNEAYKAWKRAKWDYWRQGVPYYLREHIGRGFQQGFIDVAGGGSGDLPLFAPNNYWGPGYQNPRGNEMIAAWFRGYTDGAMAGEMSGLSRYVLLPTSSAVPGPNGMPVPGDHPVDHPLETPAAPLDYLPEPIPSNPPPPVHPLEPLPLPTPPAVIPPPAVISPPAVIPPPAVISPPAVIPPPAAIPAPAVPPAPVPGKQTQTSPTPLKLTIAPAAAELDAADENAAVTVDGDVQREGVR